MAKLRGVVTGYSGVLVLVACGQTASNDTGPSSATNLTAASNSAVAGNTTTAASSNGATGNASTSQGAATSNGTQGATSSTAGSVGAGGSFVGASASGTLGGAGGAVASSTDVGFSTGSGGIPTASGTTAGAGGATAGAGGTGMQSDCTEPYTGPVGGPRESGPESLNSLCEAIPDDVILARYKDSSAKVPQGLYWEPPGIVSLWESPCSESQQSTVERASNAPLGEQEASGSSEWSYEVSGCQEGMRRFYSNLRCDYFDGETISGGSIEKLAYLASLIWWMDNGNVGGNQLLGYVGAIGDATDRVDMCSIRTTFGDFGLCDEISVEVSSHLIVGGTSVTIGEPSVVRTIQGDCN